MQSVACKLIIDRENEIKSFEPEEYWTITAQLISKGSQFEAKFYGINGQKKELHNEAEVKDIVDRIAKADFVVSEVKEKERQRNLLRRS